MHKKKIAFVLGNPMVGGVETSLIQLLSIFDYEKYDVTLFTNRENNPCVGNLPPAVHTIFFDDYPMRKVFLEKVKGFKLFSAIKIIIYYVLLKLANTDFLKCKYAAKAYRIADLAFDCAIAYKQDAVSIVTALFQINAHKKIIWIHGQLFHRKNGKYDPQYMEHITRFDKMLCVSEDCKCNCDRVFPHFNDKEIFHNIMDKKQVIKLAESPIDFCKEKTSILLLTVGRLSKEKGQDMIPQTACLLKNSGYRFSWLIIGDGMTRSTIEEKIQYYDVSEQVILLGTKTNPYPYMKACDIYVQTSYAEGWCLTVHEAKILHKPIVTTDLSVMHEQFVHMENGYITNGISSEALYEGVKCLLDNPDLCKKFTQNLAKETHNNDSEIQKLYDFLDN